jgi:hypothetical protein
MNDLSNLEFYFAVAFGAIVLVSAWVSSHLYQHDRVQPAVPHDKVIELRQHRSEQVDRHAA